MSSNLTNFVYIFFFLNSILQLLYERKRSALATSILHRCNTVNSANRTAITATTTPLHVLSILRLWERDVMLQCIDALWTDFLQDITTLQRAAMTRAFSQLDPVDEFRLEASVVFSRLLRDFRRQSAVALLQPVDIRDLQWTMQQQLQMQGNGEDDSSTGDVLDDVVWLADTMEEERKNNDVKNNSSNISNTSTTTTRTSASTSGGEERSENNGGAPSSSFSSGEVSVLGMLLDKISQASSEDLSAAMKKLDEQRSKEK